MTLFRVDEYENKVWCVIHVQHIRVQLSDFPAGIFIVFRAKTINNSNRQMWQLYAYVANPLKICERFFSCLCLTWGHLH